MIINQCIQLQTSFFFFKKGLLILFYFPIEVIELWRVFYPLIQLFLIFFFELPFFNEDSRLFLQIFSVEIFLPELFILSALDRMYGELCCLFNPLPSSLIILCFRFFNEVHFLNTCFFESPYFSKILCSYGFRGGSFLNQKFLKQSFYLDEGIIFSASRV